MEVYVGKVTDEVFAEYTSHFEDFNITAGTDLEVVRAFVLNDKRCQTFGGSIEVWSNGKLVREIDL